MFVTRRHHKMEATNSQAVKIEHLPTLIETKATGTLCPDGTTCPDQNTCCDNGQGGFNCCPMPSVRIHM